LTAPPPLSLSFLSPFGFSHGKFAVLCNGLGPLAFTCLFPIFNSPLPPSQGDRQTFFFNISKESFPLFSNWFPLFLFFSFFCPYVPLHLSRDLPTNHLTFFFCVPPLFSRLFHFGLVDLPLSNNGLPPSPTPSPPSPLFRQSLSFKPYIQRESLTFWSRQFFFFSFSMLFAKVFFSLRPTRFFSTHKRRSLFSYWITAFFLPPPPPDPTNFFFHLRIFMGERSL